MNTSEEHREIRLGDQVNFVDRDTDGRIRYGKVIAMTEDRLTLWRHDLKQPYVIWKSQVTLERRVSAEKELRSKFA